MSRDGKGVPALGEEERLRALERALEHRRERARVKEALGRGEIRFSDVLAMESEAVRRTRVSEAIGALRGYGPARAAAVMREAGVAESRRIAGLGPRQRERLSRMLG